MTLATAPTTCLIVWMGGWVILKPGGTDGQIRLTRVNRYLWLPCTCGLCEQTWSGCNDAATTCRRCVMRTQNSFVLHRAHKAKKRAEFLLVCQFFVCLHTFKMGLLFIAMIWLLLWSWSSSHMLHDWWGKWSNLDSVTFYKTRHTTVQNVLFEFFASVKQSAPSFALNPATITACITCLRSPLGSSFIYFFLTSFFFFLVSAGF